MLGKEENWFQKNRGFILGFAVVVLAERRAGAAAPVTEDGHV